VGNARDEAQRVSERDEGIKDEGFGVERGGGPRSRSEALVEDQFESATLAESIGQEFLPVQSLHRVDAARFREPDEGGVREIYRGVAAFVHQSHGGGWTVPLPRVRPRCSVPVAARFRAAQMP
jgi:hypothetical protein